MIRQVPVFQYIFCFLSKKVRIYGVGGGVACLTRRAVHQRLTGDDIHWHRSPPLFSKPGVFIVRPDGSLYDGAVQTMPFARPHCHDLLVAVDFTISKDYPARGEYTGEV
jgi:hypothetical protein